MEVFGVVGGGMVGDGVEGGRGSRSFDCMDTVSMGKMTHWVWGKDSQGQMEGW